MITLSKNQFPPHGWLFKQPQTQWNNPMAMVGYDASVEAIIKHRQANPDIATRYNLSTDYNTVSEELWQYTKTRLGITADPPGGAALPKPMPPRQARHVVGAVAGGANRGFVQRIQTAGSNLRRAAQGTAVVVDWLGAGGNPVRQELAERRAAICVGCPKNEPGSWYTQAPAEILREAVKAWQTLKGSNFEFETSQGTKLKSCSACKCLLRLKVFVDSKHIISKTPADVFPDLNQSNPRCWILEEKGQ